MGLDIGVDDYKFNNCNYVPILPLVYDDALSYIETLYQVTNKVNEVIENVNKIIDNSLEEAKKYTDSKIAEQLETVKEAVAEVHKAADEAVAEVHKVENELKQNYSDFEKVVNARLVFQDNKIDTLNTNLIAGLKSANSYTDFAIKNNNAYILDEVAKGFVTLRVVNYFTGDSVTVQEMFDYLAQFHLQNAISYEQLEAAEKSYDEMLGYDQSYSNWVLNGYNIIHG